MINNKGITTVEILICFVLVSVISSSIYSTVSMYNEKRLEESYKSRVITYSNTLTKLIQDDFVKIGLTSARVETTPIKHNDNDVGKIVTVNCDLRDGTQRILEVKQQLTSSSFLIDEAYAVDDEFMIKYGPPEQMEEYPIPDLGEVKGKYDTHIHSFVPCSDSTCKIRKDLQISNLIIDVSNDSTYYGDESQVLSIYIGFYHPEIGKKYAINIVSPINFPISYSDQNKIFRSTDFPITIS